MPTPASRDAIPLLEARTGFEAHPLTHLGVSAALAVLAACTALTDLLVVGALAVLTIVGVAAADHLIHLHADHTNEG